MQHERRKEQKEEETVASLPPSGKKQISREISHSQQNHNVLRQKLERDEGIISCGHVYV